jgi:hypothetical protein
MTDILIGAAYGVFVVGLFLGAWKVVGTVVDARRMASTAMERVEGYGNTTKEAWVRADQAQRAVHAQLKGLDKLGGVERLSDFLDRLAAMEKRLAEIDLSVLDTAEKVAARLSDRERKRGARNKADDTDELEDEAAWWARARSSHPLPGMPTDPSQLPLMPNEDS